MRVRWNSYGFNILRESDIKRKIELTQIKRQIEMLSTFMPDEILRMPLTELDDIHTYVGVLLFADVSGFTPLCEKYNKTGKGGIYRLTATLNAYIGALVEVISFYGGDILKFSGDAFLALWKAPTDLRLYEIIHKVIVCALFIQGTLGVFETEVNVLLKVKLAIACGNLTFAVIGNESYRHYIITGQAINDVKSAERISVSGDVVVAPSAWGHLAEDNYEVTFESDGNVKVWNCIYFPNQVSLKESYLRKQPVALALCVKHLEHRSQLHEKRRIDDATTDSKITERFISSLPHRTSVQKAATSWIPNDLNPFIVRPVQSQVEEKQPIEYLTEMRQVTIQFINIVPTTFQDNKLVSLVNKAYQIVCKIVSQVRGVVNKVSLFDKDCMILVLFGLRGIEHEVESQNALKSAFAIRKAVRKITTVKTVSIGVTNGLVYCGVVGHPFRREYTVIGGAVNKAARIMCAYEGKVTCDHETYKSCKLSSLYFQVQSALKLKGIADAGHIFEYNEEFDKRTVEQHENLPLIGRDAELSLAERIINDPMGAGFSSICFKGESKVGKTKLLQHIYNRFGKNKPFVCSFVLNEALQRSYYTISTIYQQLFDILSQLQPDILEDLPRHLWDFNEIMNSHKTSSELISGNIDDVGNYFVRLQENFLKIVDLNAPIYVFIDNIQFIDRRSLEFFVFLLEKKHLSIICAGSFEDNATWDTMWSLALHNQIQMYNLEPLSPQDIPFLMCKFLNVKGICKKLIILVNRTCEGRPGWVQACLLKMVNNGELEVKYALASEEEYAFLRNTQDKYLVLVAGFSKKYLENSEESSTAVTLDLFDSFSPYQQLIIKTAAVLGEIFTRTTLIVLLKYPNENMLAGAMQKLFEEEVFDCASRYVNSGGLQEKSNVCLCYTDEEEGLGDGFDLPKYAFCKLLHFKSRNIKMLAYELLPQNQKKELHLRITDLLESQNNLCPSCLHDNSASLIVMRRFKDLIPFCHDEKYIWTEKCKETQNSSDEYKSIIREYVHNPPVYLPDTRPKIYTCNDLPRRKVWDPSVCFCLEILKKVYQDLIHHSHCAQHLGKKIFFTLEYSSILTIMYDYEDALELLHEASEMCMVQINKGYVFTGKFKVLMMGKIHCLLAYIYLNMDNLGAAKNHALICLRQYNVPLISFKYSLPHLLLNKWWFLQYAHKFNPINSLDNTMMQYDFGTIMGVISNIYSVEGNWICARAAAMRSLSCLKHTNSNILVLCDIYTSALYLHTICGKFSICEKLERSFNKDALRYYSNNMTSELTVIGTVIHVLFLVKILQGGIIEACNLGYRVLSMYITTQSYNPLKSIMFTLAKALLKLKRIPEAVCLAELVEQIYRKYFGKKTCNIYYVFCVDLILETSFFLEPIERIEQYINENLQPDLKYSQERRYLLILMYCYYLRYTPSKAEAFINKYAWESAYTINILDIRCSLRYLECLMLVRARAMLRGVAIPKAEYEKEVSLLQRLYKMQATWPVWSTRYYHLKAYHCRLNKKMGKSAKFLKKSNRLACHQGNLLEQCWTMLHSSRWFSPHGYEKRPNKHLKWKSCHNYSNLEWCQLMFCLPTD